MLDVSSYYYYMFWRSDVQLGWSWRLDWRAVEKLARPANPCLTLEHVSSPVLGIYGIYVCSLTCWVSISGSWNGAACWIAHWSKNPRKSITGRSQGAELSTILSLLEEFLDADLKKDPQFGQFLMKPQIIWGAEVEVIAISIYFNAIRSLSFKDDWRENRNRKPWGHGVSHSK